MPREAQQKSGEGSPALASLVRGYLSESGMTQRQLAEKIGKSRSFVLQLTQGTKNVTHEKTAQQLARVMGIDEYDIYAKGGAIPPAMARDLHQLDGEGLRRVHGYITRIRIPTETHDPHPDNALA